MDMPHNSIHNALMQICLLVFQLWMSLIEFWNIHDWIMTRFILNWIMGIHNTVMDIHNCIVDIHKSIMGKYV